MQVDEHLKWCLKDARRLVKTNPKAKLSLGVQWNPNGFKTNTLAKSTTICG